ncbi:unnamed protein product [Brassica oleracea]|uniref:(rape) hypothetical protein n=1 Tax=Brassica napus TaxID=3708 RepID=A0A816K544_BRANA|nr:unnamed protein product [Brassica napus]
MMALKTLMSILSEIVWNYQDAKDVSLVLVGSSLMVGALMLCSVLLKAKELSLLRFHIFSGVLHDVMALDKVKWSSVTNKMSIVNKDDRPLVVNSEDSLYYLLI